MVLPIGAAYLFGNAALAEFTLLQLAHFAMLGLRLSFPIVGALTLINVALGVMVKAAPQMNVFVIGMPIKILVGFFLLLTTMVAPLNRIYNWLFDGALFALTEAIWRMAP
jgi:flagellar biosynthetic protein FliR